MTEDDLDQQFAKMWRAGKPYHVICASLHIGEARLRKMRKRLGLPIRNRRFNSPEFRAAFSKAWHDGLTYVQIADKFKIGTGQLHAISRRFNLPPRGQSKSLTDAAKEKIIELRARGLFLHQISVETGYTEGTISSFLRRREGRVTVDAGAPPPWVIEERDQRLAAPPRDLTGMIFGDPPAGFSALEGRR